MEDTMVMTKKQFCDSCQCDAVTVIVERPATYKFRGESFDINERVLQCSVCGEDLYDEDLDSETMRTLTKLYTEKVGLSLQDIKEIRKQYGLSMELFSRILGWSKSTIARYETGKFIPTSSHLIILKRLKDSPESIYEFFKQNLHKFNDKEIEKITKKLNFVDQNEVEKNLIETIQLNFKLHEKTIDTGYRVFNLEKLAHLILFFSEQGVPKTKLMKLLFYSDYLNFKDNLLSITGLPYVRLQYGPVPKDHELLLSTLEKIEFIEVSYEYSGEYEINRITALQSFDESLFDEDELEVMRKVKEKFKDYGSKSISDYSHNEDAWTKTKEREIISYTHADNLLIK